tara:strand:+ start:1528 stop:2604 length:1077 start_codon:yes stop_codon:yes gene_type:complete
VRISASQIKTYQRCPKLWWLSKIEKLPEPEGNSYGATFGSVFHSVAERYLKGEEPYPFGWSASLQEGDGKKIKWLLKEGIDKGMIVRHKSAKIEHSFKVDLISDVMISGFIDYLIPGEVVDHKTARNSRYILNEEKLAHDLQMLIYAKIALDYTDDEDITLRHNVFMREPLKVKVTKARVTKEAVLKHWESIKKVAADMFVASKRKEPPPFPTGTHCEMYGGCAFRPICFKVETMDHFRKRVERKGKPLKAIVKAKKTNLVLHIGVLETKNKYPDPSISSITLSDLLRSMVEDQGDTLEDFYNLNAFDRRDTLATLVKSVVNESLLVKVPPLYSLSPDEKALLSALRPYADVVREAQA